MVPLMLLLFPWSCWSFSRASIACAVTLSIGFFFDGLSLKISARLLLLTKGVIKSAEWHSLSISDSSPVGDRVSSFTLEWRSQYQSIPYLWTGRCNRTKTISMRT